MKALNAIEYEKQERMTRRRIYLDSLEKQLRIKKEQEVFEKNQKDLMRSEIKDNAERMKEQEFQMRL